MPDAAPKTPPTAPNGGKRSRLWQLEALRGLAALHVVLNHIFNSYLNVKHSIWNFPFRFGQEGVLVFFLLSGFVICYSHGGRKSGTEAFKTYLFKRGRRIYPIFILSLVLAYVVQCIGFNPLAKVDIRTLIANLFMLQDHVSRQGIFAVPYADNGPLWSLSYEWWFYMMFYPINRWVPQASQKYLVAGICVAGLLGDKVIPNTVFNFMAFFLIWWVGVELAREFMATGDATFRKQRTMLSLLLIPIIWYGAMVCQYIEHGRHISAIELPFIGLRYFFVALVIVLLGFVWKHWHFAGYRQTIGLFEWIGPISYALYLFHYPLIADLRLFAGTTGGIFYLDLFLRVAMAFILAWLAERWLQKRINSATDPWLAPRAV